jgi:hypothetical protein
MVTADLWPALPANPTWLGVLVVVIVVLYLLAKLCASLLRTYTANQQTQIDGLRDSLEKQADRHAAEMSEMRSKIDRLELISEEARAERHFLRGEIGKYRMAMSITDDLRQKCTCGALDPIESVIRSLNLEDDPWPTFPRRPDIRTVEDQ